MNYLRIDEIARLWGVSKRRVQVLCAEGKIPGATRFGRDWMIPEDAKKPTDGRTKAGRLLQSEDMPLPRKTPFLYMSDLYRTPGEADAVGAGLAYNHEAQVLFEAEVAYSRGEISLPDRAHRQQHSRRDHGVKARMLAEKIARAVVNLVDLASRIGNLCLKKHLRLVVVGEPCANGVCLARRAVKIAHI